MNYYDKKAVSASLLKACLKSPLHGFQFLYEGIEATDSMNLGTLAHHYVLTPDAPMTGFHIAEEGARFSQAQKDALKAEGKTIIRSYQADQAKAMADAVKASFPAVALLTGAKTEQEFSFQIGETPCKAKVDAFKDDVLIDLKTGSHASVERFEATVVNADYHTQLAFYRRALEATGTKVSRYYIVHVTNSAPYVCRVFQLSDALIEAGDARAGQAFATAGKLLKGWTPGQPETVINLDLPKWASMEATE